MKNKRIRLIATVVMLAMLVGMTCIMPLATSAAEAGVSTASATDVPTDITPWNGKTGSGYAGGTGSAEDPYQIATAEQLEYFRQNTLKNATADVTAHFKLTSDIVYNATISDSSKSITGSYNSKGKVFAGTFDGGGHTIYNLYSNVGLTGGSATSLALFQDIGPDGVIKNLNVDGVYLKPTNTSTGNAAVIAYGSMKGTLSNIHVKNATLEAVTVSGLVHDVTNTGSVSNCSVENLTATGTNVGGITYSIVFGSVMQLKNCTVSGSLTATVNAGGIAANASGNLMLMESCSNRADVNGGEKAGGLVGKCEISSNNGALCVTACVNYGSIVSAGYAGGLFGYYSKPNTGLRLVSCSNYGSVDGVTASGGFLGYQAGKADQTVVLRGCMINADIGMKGTSVYSGGVVGHFSAGAGGRTLITSTLIKVNVKATEYAGSIIGCTTNTGTGSNAQNLDSAWVYAIVTAGTKASDWAVVSNGNDLQKGSPTGTNGYYIVKNGTASTSNTVAAADFDSTAYNTLKNFSTTYKYSGTNQTTYATTPWIRDKDGMPILINTLGISGATMSLGGNMALNMKLAASSLAGTTGEVSVAFVNGEDANATVTNDGTYYTASYTGIRAADMAEEMELHLVITIAGTEYVSTNILTYSPLTYLTNLYEDYTTTKANEDDAEEVLAVVTKMLNYGAVAEANAKGITVAETAVAKAVGVTEALTFDGDGSHVAGITDLKGIAKVGATLTGGIELTFTLNAGYEYTTLSIADVGVYYADENGKITVTGINAAMIKDTLRLTFTGDGMNSATVNFTVGDFLESRRANADETALAEATIMYMKAVRAYALTH